MDELMERYDKLTGVDVDVDALKELALDFLLAGRNSMAATCAKRAEHYKPTLVQIGSKRVRVVAKKKLCGGYRSRGKWCHIVPLYEVE